MGSQDNTKCLSGYVFWINVLLKIGFFWTTFFSPGSCQDARVLECPAVFRNGGNLIYCTVNTTALNEGGCSGVGAVIGFEITVPGQAPVTTCDADLINCDTTFNAGGCRCVSHAPDRKRYELNFTGDSSVHTNGSFDCIITCLSGSPPPTVKDPSCDPIDFTSPTMPPTTATTVAPTTTTPNTTSAPPDSSPSGTNLLYLLLLLLLIPIVVVIIIVWYCFCNNGGINGTKKAEEGELKSSTQNQQTTNGNRTADGKRSGQRDNKVGTGHVATNGAHNGEKVSKPVQETELTKVQETSSAPSGVEETSLNGTS